MHRPSKNHTVRLASVSLSQGWKLNLVVIIKVKVSMREEEVVVIIIKEFIVGIYTLKLNLFKLIARVSYHRVCRQKSKLTTTYLTTL